MNIIMENLNVTIGDNTNSLTKAAIYEMKFSEHADIIATIAMVARCGGAYKIIRFLWQLWTHTYYLSGPQTQNLPGGYFLRLWYN